MSKLIELTELNSTNFIDMLRDTDIIMYENIQACKIFVKYDGEKFIIKNQSINNNPISKIDLALQKYYSKAFDYLESLDDRAKKLLNPNWYYVFQYFPDKHSNYDKIPKNNLILSFIVKNETHIFNVEEIIEYSKLFDVDAQPILFYGKLNDKQIELISYFLHTKPKDLEYIFGNDNLNFASFFYKILNPQMNNSFLMNNGNYQDLEKIIIRLDNKDELCLAILNPLYVKNTDKEGNHVDTYTIIINDFLEFLQSIDIERRFIKGNDFDDIYLDIMADLFNLYMSQREERIVNFDFIIPPFFYDEKFKMNLSLINNTKTKYYIMKDEKLEYVFKMLLSAFRFKKKKAIGVFTDNTLKIFNHYVDKIKSTIDRALRIENEEDLIGTGLLDFGQFFKVKYDKGDGDNKVYLNKSEPKPYSKGENSKKGGKEKGSK